MYFEIYKLLQDSVSASSSLQLTRHYMHDDDRLICMVCYCNVYTISWPWRRRGRSHFQVSQLYTLFACHFQLHTSQAMFCLWMVLSVWRRGQHRDYKVYMQPNYLLVIGEYLSSTSNRAYYTYYIIVIDGPSPINGQRETTPRGQLETFADYTCSCVVT